MAVTIENMASVFSETDRMAEEYARKKSIPGMAYGLIYQGQLVHTGQCGYARMDEKVKAGPEMHFRIASMTKSITCMAVLILHRQGKLDIHAPLQSLVPETANWTVPMHAPITVKQLMCHMAGFPEDNPWGDRHLDQTEADFLRFLEGGVSFSTVPGTCYEYSNMGFALLGQIIKNTSGQPYQQFITEHILQPLGMNSTYWEFSDIPARQLADGYRRTGDQWEKEPLLHDGVYGAMGGLISTVHDFARYIAFHQSAYNSSIHITQAPLPAYDLLQMHHPWNMGQFEPEYIFPDGHQSAVIHAYGYGLYWMKDAAQRVFIGHSGSEPGFNSHWWMLPQYDLAVVTLANQKFARIGDFNLLLLDKLFDRCAPEPAGIPVTPVLKQRQEALIRVLPDWENARHNPVFAMNFFLDHYEWELKKTCTQIYAGIGTPVTAGPLTAENNLRGSFELHGSKGKATVCFTLTPEKEPLIQSFSIEIRS